MAINDPIEAAISSLPEPLLTRSGAVFYSGRRAFSSPRRLYILGLNPGGRPAERGGDTIRHHLDLRSARSEFWSEYSDECWQGRAAGTHGIQPKLLHLFKKLGVNAGEVPASNVVFVRSRSEVDLSAEKASLLELCWPVHQAVIESLGIRVVLCLGKTASKWVRGKLTANNLVGTFEEANSRRWVSRAYRNDKGLVVIQVTHPTPADWRNPAADPTPLIQRFL